MDFTVPRKTTSSISNMDITLTVHHFNGLSLTMYTCRGIYVYTLMYTSHLEKARLKNRAIHFDLIIDGPISKRIVRWMMLELRPPTPLARQVSLVEYTTAVGLSVHIPHWDSRTSPRPLEKQTFRRTKFLISKLNQWLTLIAKHHLKGD